MHEQEARAISCPPGEGVTVENPLGGPLTFKLRREQTNGALTVFESTPAPGEGPPLHVHVNEDEMLYVLEGSLRFSSRKRFTRPRLARSCSYPGAHRTRGRT